MPLPELPTESRDWSADPAGYAREVLSCRLWERQEEILTALTRHRRVAVRSCHHSGKTFCAAVAVHWFLSAYDPALVITTAPTDRQMRKLLWYEIAQQQRRGSLAGRLQQTELERSPTQRAYGFSTNTPERFQGWHSENLLVIVDEASGVSEEIYEAIEGILTSENAKLLLIGNPNRSEGTFFHAFTSPLYRTFHIGAADVPAHLLPPAWKEERRAEWGEESPVYQVRVLGEFPDQADDALISLKWVTRAQERWEEAPAAGPVVIGFDVARMGADESCAAVRIGDRIEALHCWRGQDTMASVGRVAALAAEYQASLIQVDEVGIGAGVLDRLAEQGLPAVGVNVGEQAFDSEHYFNRRAELFFALKERLKSEEIALPDDPTLAAQLTTLRYTYSSNAKLKLESKEDARKRGLPSPDRADAVALAFAFDPYASAGTSFLGSPRPSGGFQWRD